MKLILAMLRISMMNETKAALSDVGLPSFTAMPIVGRGKGRGDGPAYGTSPNDPELIDYKKTLNPQSNFLKKEQSAIK